MRVPRGSGPRCAFLAATSLTLLKSLLRRAVRPVAGRLYEAGVTANQVTSTSLVGSVLVGALLCRFADHSSSFAILPAWLVARTAFAAIDGTLAVEFGQKSRLGGVLNEVGDVVSDIALFRRSALGWSSPFGIACASRWSSGGRKPSNSMDFDDNNRSVGSLSRAY
jgi:CDP-diacylglycerol---glycerol-3-phosphate 3-phosphatidyltransferase